MSVHESSVNFQNLIRDLAEMYPYDVSEVVIAELVANSLDSKATRISIDYNQDKKTLIITDNGEGMSDSQFDEYHDFAVGLKTRGTGIGFAGIGAKISFNIATRVITKTRNKSFSGGSNWYLQSKKKLVWENIKVSNFSGNGTRVEVHFTPNSKPSYSIAKDIVKVLRRHYLPLLDRNFLELYEHMGYYSNNIRFIVNGQTIKPYDVIEDLVLDKVRKFFPTRAGKRMGYGLFGISTSDYPLGTDAYGILLCTHGKVIKPDLFNQFPGSIGPRLFGIVEVPGFINFLTTSKTDFIRGRGKHREFEGLYDPIRQEFKTWLTEIGVQPLEVTDADQAIKLERELRKVIDDIPELGEFFGFRAKKTVFQHDNKGKVLTGIHNGVEVTFPDGEGKGKGGEAPLDIGDKPGHALTEDKESGTEKAEPISRTSRKGPKISFISVPERVDIAWVDGNHVVINSGHPSYEKSHSNPTARRIHCLFAIGIAIQKFMADADNTQNLIFVDRLMSAWGKK